MFHSAFTKCFFSSALKKKKCYFLKITDVIPVLYNTQINLLVSLFIKYLSSTHPRLGTSKVQGTQKQIKYRSLFNDFFHFLLNQFHFLRVTTAGVCFQCTHIYIHFLKFFGLLGFYLNGSFSLPYKYLIELISFFSPITAAHTHTYTHTVAHRRVLPKLM